jgi:hypothetical protein
MEWNFFTCRFKYYTEIHDVQMLAMISCILEYQSLPEAFTGYLPASSFDEFKHIEHRDVSPLKDLSVTFCL